MYLAWHNTHTPLECPPEWMYPPLGMHGGLDFNNNSQRMTYNCMSRILDDGVGNVTAALKAGGLWPSTLMLFSADNGGWAGGTGSNNYPLRECATAFICFAFRCVSMALIASLSLIRRRRSLTTMWL